MKLRPTFRASAGTPFWLDERFWRVIGQVVFLAALLIVLRMLVNNMLTNMARQGLSLSFAFLDDTAGFDIGESAIAYARSDRFARAFLVGLLNTLQVSFLGILVATIIGVIVGVARLSTNFLVQQIARAYIEFLRNIPLLVLLIFLYIGAFIKFPRVQQAVVLPGPVFLTNRGVAFPWGDPTPTFGLFLAILGVGLLLAVLLGVIFSIRQRKTGRSPFYLPWAVGIILAAALLGWLLPAQRPLLWDPPQIRGLRIAGGLLLSPEFMALFSGLAIYTSAFIADVVRAGIQAIAHGQVEAARSLGLPGLLTLRLIVFPQALRVIVPPLTSQYLNLIKNSSLAVAIGYPELFHVSGTILNQSGRTVEMISLVMATYLSISLATSAFMNWYNNRVRLVER